MVDDQFDRLQRVDLAGSPPIVAIASRIAARSTTHGTPVKSWSSTRAGRYAISLVAGVPGCHDASAVMSPATTERPSSNRSRFSSRILSEYGSVARSYPRSARAPRRKYS
jgi:hypothetical protein